MWRNYSTNSLTEAIYTAAYLWFKQMFSCAMLHRSNGDVRIFQPSVVLWIPATVLDKIPGVGLGAAGSGHAPDRHLQLSLPKLWHGRPSALQPESPGLCPCCRQRGVHPLPESLWAQVGRWVLISAHGGVFGPNKIYLKVRLCCCWSVERTRWSVEEQRAA